MFVTALLLGLVGVFCILDSRILGRMNFERPLITCTIVGALLGDLQTGLTLGASIELMSLGIVNIGAAAPPDMNMAAIICAAFAILTDASAETALALAIPIAVLGQMLGVLMRTILSNLTHVADHAIAEGKFRKAWSMHIVWGTLLYSLMYFIPIFLSVYFGTDLVQKIVAFIPAWLTDGLNLGSKFLTAYGIALLLSTMLNRDLTVYFLLGFFFVGYLGLDITAVAIFAAILAVEILQQVEGFDKYDKMIEGLTNVFEAAENAANSARKSAKEFAEKYKDAPVVYVMSSGASMEVAYSTSICLMMEMQWVNSGSFHSGEFFHGPFEIVDKDVPFILLMNDGKTRPVDARALTFLHRFDALTTVVDAKDYGLGNAVDSSVITYFNPLMHTAVFRVYAEELSYVRQHPLTLRRYMWKLEY